MSALRQDVLHSLRLLARNPGFTAVAVLILAIAMGANTAVFSIMDGVLLRALPYPEPDGIVDVAVLLPPGEGQAGRASFLDSRRLAIWPGRTATIERLAAYRVRTFTLSGTGFPERVTGASLGTALFPLLRVPPVVGRTFLGEEGEPGRGQVAVLSHRLWQRRFQGDPGIVGQRVTLDGVAHTVVGVMPPTFFFPHRKAEIWTPLPLKAPASQASGSMSVDYLPAVARLRDGVALNRAEAEAQAFFERLGEDTAGPVDDLRGGRLRLMPLRDAMVSEVRPAVLALGAGVGLVLLIACINLANLLLARNTARQREMAIRSAVGGSRARLVRQMLTESTVLSLTGGVAGTLLAVWSLRLLPRLLPGSIPRIEEIGLDVRVFCFAFLLSAATGALFGLLPALRSADAGLVAPLHGGVAEGSARRSRARGLLVVAEVALAFVLLVSGGLLVRSYLELVRVELGYQPEQVLTAALALDPVRYRAPARAEELYDELLRRLGEHPRVRAAGVVSYPPLTPDFSLTSLTVAGEPRSRTLAIPQMTSPGYLQAMGLRLVAGRWLTARDMASGARVAVVNETFAHRYIASGDPLGREVQMGPAALEIVGVLRDARTVTVQAAPKPEIFTSYHHARAITGQAPERLTLALRTVGEPTDLLPALRAVVARLDPELALEDVRSMNAKLAASSAEPRFYALLLGSFAGIGLLIAAAGVYGVLAYMVARQSRAIGVRRALGARGKDILAMVLGRGLGLVALGIGIGFSLAVVTAKVLSHLLFGITARDPLSFGVAALALLGAGALACYLPARRATRVDPMEALRSEG